MNETLKNRLNACKVDKSIALIAPAGSGKTTVLIARILTLAAFGEDINSIITITYTDNAAASIKERIIKAAKQVYEDYVALSEDDKIDGFISLKLIFFNSFIKSETDRADAKVGRELDDFIKDNFVKLNEAGYGSGGGSSAKFKLLTPAEIYLTVLNNLSNINISTFHGFFHRIINLFPIESGLLPGFGIIDDNESVYIKRNLINEFFLAHLANSATGDLEKRLVDFFYVFNDSIVNSQKGVDLILNSVLEKFDLVAYSIILFAGALEAGSNYSGIFDYNIQQILDSGIIEYLFRLDESGITEFNEVKNGLEDFEKLILGCFKFLFENENLKNLLALLGRAAYESKNAAVKEGIELLKLNIKGLAADKAGESKNKDIRFLINFYKSIKDGLKQINYFINLKNAPFIPTDSEKELITLLYLASVDFYKKVNFLNYISFTIIIFKIIKAYESEKKSRNVIDFSGIEFKALMLLHSANFQYVEEKLNYKINHLLIDEFQDANRIEFELIKRIMNERLSGMGLSGERQIKGTIFFVGDPNQSIYGFRSSDYKIFNEAILYFKSRASHDFKFEDIVLEENFRSTKKLIQFQNIIFSNPYFRCLEGSAANVSSGLSGNEDMCDTGNPDFYPVILKLYKNNRNASAGQAKLASAEENSDSCRDSEDSSVAYEIRRILDSGKKNNLSLASHIKIVSRKHRGRGWDSLKNSLVKNNIPFKIYGDRGFYEKKEIDLILSILKFFFNDKDELSIFKLLKVLSNTKYNEEIPLEIVNFVENGFEKLSGLNELNEPNEENEENNQINSLTPYFIIKRIYNIFNIYSLYSRDAQALANLKKLLLIAHNYGRATAYEFLRDIEERINLGYKEQEEEIDTPAKEPGNEDNGKVSLMTIHGAKGLENDIVFVYGTSLNPIDNKNSDAKYKFDIIFEANKPEFIPFPEFILLNDKITCNPLRMKSGATEVEEVSDILDKKREKEKLKEENEFKRLIYVALTRPRFLCYITDEIKDNKKNDHVSWTDIISGQKGQKDLNLENAEKIRELVLALRPEDDNQMKDRFEKIVSFIKNINMPGGCKDRGNFDDERLIFNAKDIINRRLDAQNIFKSEFNIKNPSYFKGGENPKNAHKNIENSSEKLLDMGTAPLIRGLLVHKILEIIGKFNRDINLDTDIDINHGKGIRRAHGLKYLFSIIKIDILKLLMENTFSNSDDLKKLAVDLEEQIGILFRDLNKLKIRNFINEGYNEIQYLRSSNIEFNGYFKGDLINGRIDKLVLKENREDKNIKIIVDIYDYKTGSSENFVKGSSQLDFYADAVKDAFGDENILELKKYYYFIDEDNLTRV